MTWAAIQSALQTVVAQQSGLPTHWVKRSSGWRAPAHARLELLGLRSIGVDEARLDYDEGADKIVQRRLGQRVLRVQIAVETTSQNLGESAVMYAERIKSRLPLEEVHDALGLVGIAFSAADDVIALDYEDEEGRSISFAGFEARFNLTTIERGEDLDRIAEVVINGELRHLGTPDEDPADYEVTTTVSDP